MNEIAVTDARDLRRYEARGGGLLGFLDYRRTPHTIVLVHTEVLPGREGRGVGSALARAALEAARRDGLAVHPMCPFVAEFIRRHPEHYADLVDERWRRRTGG